MLGRDDYYEDNIVKDRMKTNGSGHDSRNANDCSIKEVILHLTIKQINSAWTRNNPIIKLCHRMTQWYCVISNNINLSNNLMTYTMWTIDQVTNTNMLTMVWYRMWILNASIGGHGKKGRMGTWSANYRCQDKMITMRIILWRTEWTLAIKDMIPAI